MGSARDPDDVAPGEVALGSRTDQVAAIDARIGEVIAAGPNGAEYIVASSRMPGRASAPGLVIARGPHFWPGVLVSGSTKQEGLAQIPDITATVLASRSPCRMPSTAPR